MGIKYSVLALKNPTRREEPAKYYAKAQVRELITENEIAADIAFATSLTKGDVANVLRNLPYVVKRHLLKGDMVELGSLGKFQFQVKSKGAYTREEFTYHNIKGIKFHYRPGSEMTEGLDQVEYDEVLPRKMEREARREARKSPSQG